MHTACEELDLSRLFVVYPGERRFDLDDRVEALPFGGLAAALRGL